MIVCAYIALSLFLIHCLWIGIKTFFGAYEALGCFILILDLVMLTVGILGIIGIATR